MALTEFQRAVCHLIAAQRRASGESYIAGGVALNVLTSASRISRDIDLFHDTIAAVASNWEGDKTLLRGHGYQVEVAREREGFVEATISKDSESVLMQWAADSAFRFFPLLEHADFGLTLHPFDLATNKVLALVGRLEVRDWIDLIGCHDHIQSLGYLAWAASGKDPGFSPGMILEQAGRSGRYSTQEVNTLIFAGPAPDAASLSQSWQKMLREARELIELLPPAQVGKCVLAEGGQLFHGDSVQLRQAIEQGKLRFHEGRIRGALPMMALDCLTSSYSCRYPMA